MIKNKLKALMKLANKTQKDISEKLQIFPQNFGRKLNTNNFDIAELILFAEATGCEIHFVSKQTNEVLIKLNANDLTQK